MTMPTITFAHVTLAVGVAFFIFILWRLQKSEHPFNLADIFMDPATNRASLNAVTIAVMAALSVWVCVDRESAKLADVPSLLIGVLGIFVAGRVGAQAINAFKPPSDPPPATTTQEVTRVTTTSVSGVPPVPPIDDVAPLAPSAEPAPEPAAAPPSPAVIKSSRRKDLTKKS